jgi:hypothetical protein
MLLPVSVILAALLFTGCSASTNFELPAEFTGAYNEALTAPLVKAIADTDDVQLSQFSQKLLEGYKLSELKENAENETGSIASLLPDIRYINKVAMETTLREAGKTLDDPELSDFYSSFINRIGIDN